MKIYKEISEHYIWGQVCDGWHLLKTDSLNIIQERMPPGTEELEHFHQKAQQFFFILKGTATFEIDGESIKINEQEGIHIKPYQKHRIRNLQADDLEFLVISEPRAQNDRRNI